MSIKKVGENPAKEYSPKTFSLSDTSKLQLASLDLFAAELGYFRDTIMNNYYNQEGKSRDKMVVSLDTLQTWHNLNFSRRYGLFEPNSLESNSSRLKLNINDMKRAIAAKLVTETKIQRKKNGELVITDHQIKFA